MISKEDQERIHNCRRVLRMISELHVRGYQQLRMVPHLYSLGTWRCGITWAGNVRADHGAVPCDWSFEATLQYTSASGSEVYGWADAKLLSPSRLADMFIKRHATIARRGRGPDWAYAGWFSWMLHETYPDCLPVAFGEFLEVPLGGLITIGGREKRISPPPPGACSAVDAGPAP
jgi:hypothetical protein